jgi:D-alanyl-D-alanine carboxypeptidase
MNGMAKKLNLKKTAYTNPHGLSDKGNKSTAEDQAKLGAIFMKNQFLSEVVKTVKYTCILHN